MAFHQRIWVGPEKFIIGKKFDTRPQAALELDELRPFEEHYQKTDILNQFWNKTQSQCMVECCGIDAFRFWPQDIQEVKQELGQEALLEALDQLQQRLNQSQKEVVAYHRLNQSFAKSTFLELIDYLIQQISQDHDAS